LTGIGRKKGTDDMCKILLITDTPELFRDTVEVISSIGAK